MKEATHHVPLYMSKVILDYEQQLYIEKPAMRRNI